MNMRRIGEAAIVESGLVIPQVGHDGHARIYETDRPVSRQKKLQVHSHGTAVGCDKNVERSGQDQLLKS